MCPIPATVSIDVLYQREIQLPGGRGKNSLSVFRHGDNLLAVGDRGKVYLNEPLDSLAGLTIRGYATCLTCLPASYRNSGAKSAPLGHSMVFVSSLTRT